MERMSAPESDADSTTPHTERMSKDEVREDQRAAVPAWRAHDGGTLAEEGASYPP